MYSGIKDNINIVLDHLVSAGLINQGSARNSLSDVMNYAWNRAEEINTGNELLLVNSRKHCLNIFLDLLKFISDKKDSRFFQVESSNTNIREITFLSNSEVFIAKISAVRKDTNTPRLDVEISSITQRSHKINLFIGFDNKGYKDGSPFSHLDISSDEGSSKWVRHCKLSGAWGSPEKVNNFIARLFLLLDNKAIKHSRLSREYFVEESPSGYADLVV